MVQVPVYFSAMNLRGRRLGIAVVASALLLSGACGEADAPQGDAVTQPAPQTTAPSSETDPAPTTAAPSESEPVGSPAPDFMLELAGGGTFVLSEQTTPVLIIFWAEW